MNKLLDKKGKKYVMDLYCSNDKKNYNVLRYAFYLGYRYALSIIDEIKPMEIENIIDKILCTEYELDFTMPCQARELRKCNYYKNEENPDISEVKEQQDCDWS